MKKCPRCSSVWVCWNWLHFKNEWAHECWNCANCWMTLDKAKRGIPYFLLKLLSRFFVDDDLFEKNLCKDFEDMTRALTESEDQ